MKSKSILIFMLFALVLGASALADDIAIGDAEMTPLRWGPQSVTYELTNNSDNLKFVAIKVNIDFEGSYLDPQRSTTSFVYLIPEESRKVTIDYSMPGNFGKANLMVEMYDIVDTLDMILPSQKFFEQPFNLRFKIPEGMQQYISEKINLPPRVEDHPAFDNEFSRIIMLMIDEGKTISEIAEMAEVDEELVNSMIDEYAGFGYVAKTPGGLQLGFPVIKTAEAEEERTLALAIADSIVARVEMNLEPYLDTLAVMANAGIMSADSNEFYDGGSVLYRRYPSFGTFLLWYHLGRNFITRSAPLLLYDGTDPCNAKLPYYMYAVQGGDIFNGSQFYAPFYGPYGSNIIFADSTPMINCEGWFRPQRPGNNWASQLQFEEIKPEVFVVDTAIALRAVKALSGDSNDLLQYTYSNLFDLADKYGHYKVLFGHRYWFWNLVATRSMEKMIEKGICQRSGEGLYRFDCIQPKTENLK